MIKTKHHTKKELRGMLDAVFAQHRDKATLLVLSDTNIFPDDKRGESLAVKHAQKFNTNIYRFSNPKYAEGSDAQGIGLIEDVSDQDLEDEPPAKPPKAKATPRDEGDLTEQLAQKVEAEEKEAEAKKTGTIAGKKTAGVKAKR